MKPCRECGADLRPETVRCPLCGAEMRAREVASPPPVADVESYQEDLRRLREQLRRLRDGAEAV